jgi:anti-sigma factor RsiW
MSCERALPLLYDLADGDIERDNAVWLALHLAACRNCADELAKLRKAEAFLSSRMSVDPPSDLALRIAQSAELAQRSRRRDSLWLGLAALVAAACLIVLLAPVSGPPAALAALWEQGASAAHFFATLPSSGTQALIERTPGWTEKAAHFLPDGSGERLTLTLVAMILVQLLGSVWLLTLKSSRQRAGNGS